MFVLPKTLGWAFPELIASAYRPASVLIHFSVPKTNAGHHEGHWSAWSSQVESVHQQLSVTAISRHTLQATQIHVTPVQAL